MKTNITLFLTGFLQVLFVSINTYFISKESYIGALFAAFIISVVWSYNIKKVAFGTVKDRIVYSSGASAGCVTGGLVK